MIVYHGSSEIVKSPDVLHSYRPLDFGRGFYLTTNLEQAERWARRKADLKRRGAAYVNVYEMSEDTAGLRVKTFAEDLLEWIEFVCDCRDGKTGYLAYDLVRGRVADDKGFRVVDLFHAGIWDKERAIREIRVYPGYDQLALITQEAIDKLLVFKSADEV